VRSAASREACRVVRVPATAGARECRAPDNRAKAMEEAKNLDGLQVGSAASRNSPA
jgi:hypothetical protein